MNIFVFLIIFYTFCFLDKYITRKRISPGASNEANPLTRLAFRYLPRFLHNTLDVLYAIVATVIVLVLPTFYATWLIATLTVGHILGFLSWTSLNPWKEQEMNWNLVFGLSLLILIVVGYLVASLVKV